MSKRIALLAGTKWSPLVTESWLYKRAAGANLRFRLGSFVLPTFYSNLNFPNPPGSSRLGYPSAALTDLLPAFLIFASLCSLRVISLCQVGDFGEAKWMPELLDRCVLVVGIDLKHNFP